MKKPLFVRYPNAIRVSLKDRAVTVVSEEGGVYIDMRVVDGNLNPRCIHRVLKGKAVNSAFRMSEEAAKGLAFLLLSEYGSVFAGAVQEEFFGVSDDSEEFYCNCSRPKGLKHDEDGMPYCVNCGKPVQ